MTSKKSTIDNSEHPWPTTIPPFTTEHKEFLRGLRNFRDAEEKEDPRVRAAEKLAWAAIDIQRYTQTAPNSKQNSTGHIDHLIKSTATFAAGVIQLYSVDETPYETFQGTIDALHEVPGVEPDAAVTEAVHNLWPYIELAMDLTPQAAVRG